MKSNNFEKRNRKQKLQHHNVQIQVQKSEAELNQEIYARFQNFMTNQRFQKLKHAMDNYLGRNTPIRYHPQFNFQQQWQSKKKMPQQTFSDFLHTHNLVIQLLALIIMVGYCVLAWFISFQLVFQEDQIRWLSYFDSLGIIIVLTHLTLKIVLKAKQSYSYLSLYYFLVNYGIDLIVLAYFIVRISMINKSLWIHSAYTIVFDILFIFNAYRKGAEIYKSFKMKIITSIYKDYFYLFDLLATSLIVAHLFALMLYFVGNSTDEAKTWIKVAGIDDQDTKTKYIYSLYFACTTMLTVGYGDLTPANVTEVMTVLIIEIFGIAIFAYVINEIGHTLSSMRTQQESLEKDLSSLSKVSKYYGLDEQLQTKARAYIIDNQRSLNDLLPQQQKELLMKLNDQLRTEINQQNSLKIIKSSVFFICHWSKKMQYEVAKKLTKKLYSPNEKLLQTPGKQSIYVIKKGKVNIYTDRHSGLKRHFKKLLKTIQISDNENVTHNVYGYTNVVSSRPIRLNAVTKDFTVVYYLQKNDFIESLMDHEFDFQYYHEIKIRIDLQKMPEAYEAPSILNIREHYRPNVFFVIKRNKKQFMKNKRNDNIRDQSRPYKRRMKLHIYKCIQELEGEFEPTSKLIASRQLMLKTKTFTDNNMATSFNEYFNQESEMKRKLHMTFDSHKQYENYFKKFNLSNVLMQLETQNFSEISKKAKIATMKSLKMLRTKKQIKFSLL